MIAGHHDRQNAERPKSFDGFLRARARCVGSRDNTLEPSVDRKEAQTLPRELCDSLLRALHINLVVPHELLRADENGFSFHARFQTMTGHRGEIFDRRRFDLSLLCLLNNCLSERMIRPAFDACLIFQHLSFLKIIQRNHIRHLRLPLGERPRLVENARIETLRVLKRGCVLDEDIVLRTNASANGDGSRRGKS